MVRSSRAQASRALLALALVATALLSAPQPAVAAADDTELVQCLSGSNLTGCTTSEPYFQGTEAEVTPDGNQLLVYSRDVAVIRMFDIGSGNLLTARSGAEGCYTPAGGPGCTAVPNLEGFFDLTVSDDGTSVYLASLNNLISLTRDPATGVLTPSTCYGPGTGCTAVPGMGFVSGVAVSPDGLHVYLQGENQLLLFDRTTSTGALTLRSGLDGCYGISSEPCTEVMGLFGFGFQLELSPDGTSLYAAFEEGGLVVFRRDTDGTLTQPPSDQGGCYLAIEDDGSNPCTVLPDDVWSALQGSMSATVSPSGKHVFVSGNNGTVAFARSKVDGLLTMTDCLTPTAVSGCHVGVGAGGMGVEVSPDGRRAAVAGADIGGVGFYDFDEATGELSQLALPSGCYGLLVVAPDCTAGPGGAGLSRVAWAPDGLNAYVASGPVWNIAQDVPPACQPVNVQVPAGELSSIQLSCSDIDGDPITAMSVVTQPHGAQVGGIALADQSILYSPLNGFAGPDSFTYTATAGGVTSAPATVQVTVQPPDTSVKITIRTSRLQLDRKGKAKVKLTCPASERSGPCTGRLKVKTQGKVSFNGRNKVVLLATATYSVPAGSTKAVVVKLSGPILRLVRTKPAARKLSLVAAVRDTAGNHAIVKRQATLRLPG